MMAGSAQVCNNLTNEPSRRTPKVPPLKQSSRLYPHIQRTALQEVVCGRTVAFFQHATSQGTKQRRGDSDRWGKRDPAVGTLESQHDVVILFAIQTAVSIPSLGAQLFGILWQPQNRRIRKHEPHCLIANSATGPVIVAFRMGS